MRPWCHQETHSVDRTAEAAKLQRQRRIATNVTREYSLRGVTPTVRRANSGRDKMIPCSRRLDMRLLSAFVFCASTLVSYPRLARAQASSDTARVIDHVTATADSRFHYAVALPTGFDSTRKAHPVLFVMDPRGRALIALALFREAATSLGWVVVSAYETASDDPNAPNVAAMEALIDDAQRKWRIDMRRVYLAGFSGTARFAWQMSGAMQGSVRGIFMAGAGLSSYAMLGVRMNGGSTVPALAVSSGNIDFNWSEIRATQDLLRDQPTILRFWYFNGTHQWPPKEIASDIIEWFQAEAMRQRFMPADSAWLAARRVRLAARADSLQKVGALEEAASLFADVARDGTMSNALEGARRRDAIARLPAMRAYVARLVNAQRDEQQAFREVAKTFAALRDGELPNDAARLTNALRIPQLMREAVSIDSVRALSAKRRLEHLMGTLTFYEPRGYMSNGDSAHVRTLLRTAAAIDSARAERAAQAVGFSTRQ